MFGLAPRLPLTRNNSEGFALLTDYNDLARQNLKMLVLTCPGERMMDPEFGVGARHYLFENMTPETFSNFESRLRNQQRKYLPYLTIEKVDFFTADQDPTIKDNTLGIKIMYFNNVMNTRNILAIPVSF